jgi:hypothetical protein
VFSTAGENDINVYLVEGVCVGFLRGKGVLEDSVVGVRAKNLAT